MSSRVAIKVMLSLLICIVLFHLSIMLKIVPYDIVWGGRIECDCEMYAFESISILINLFLFPVLLVKGKYIKELIPIQFVDVILWTILAVFSLNTIGNLLSESTFEKFFAILTLVTSYLIWIILRRNNKEHTNYKNKNHEKSE